MLRSRKSLSALRKRSCSQSHQASASRPRADLGRKPWLDRARRHAAADNMPGRHIAADHGACADNRTTTIADRDAREDRGTMADPDIGPMVTAFWRRQSKKLSSRSASGQ